MLCNRAPTTSRGWADLKIKIMLSMLYSCLDTKYIFFKKKEEKKRYFLKSQAGNLSHRGKVSKETEIALQGDRVLHHFWSKPVDLRAFLPRPAPPRPAPFLTYGAIHPWARRCGRSPAEPRMRIAPQKRPSSFSVSSGGGWQAVRGGRLVYRPVSNLGQPAKILVRPDARDRL